MKSSIRKPFVRLKRGKEHKRGIKPKWALEKPEKNLNRAKSPKTNMAKKNAPAPAATEGTAKPTREESTAYLADVVIKLIAGNRVDERDYKLAIGYIDGRRGGLSQTGMNRFADVAEVKAAHDTARAAYPAKAKAILTEHKDILIKMFNAKPGQKSITKDEYSKVAAVLEEPFSRGDEKGGLISGEYAKNEVTKKRECVIPGSYEVAKELGAQDIIDAAAKYRETVRVHVLSPLYLASIYIRQNAGKAVAPDEKADLKTGITVLENGEPVAKPFVEGGKLTKFGVEVCNNARRMLGGKKGETLDMALQVSESRTRRSQINPPRPAKDGPEPGE